MPSRERSFEYEAVTPQTIVMWRARCGERSSAPAAGRAILSLCRSQANLSAAEYARWRERKLRRGALTAAPTVAPGHYALVLVAFDPSTTEEFIRHGAARHLTPPKVGEFKPAIEPTVALAAVLACWLEAFECPVALAPPLLYSGDRWRVADLGFEWPLAPYGRERR